MKKLIGESLAEKGAENIFPPSPHTTLILIPPPSILASWRELTSVICQLKRSFPFKLARNCFVYQELQSHRTVSRTLTYHPSTSDSQQLHPISQGFLRSNYFKLKMLPISELFISTAIQLHSAKSPDIYRVHENP